MSKTKPQKKAKASAPLVEVVDSGVRVMRLAPKNIQTANSTVGGAELIDACADPFFKDRATAIIAIERGDCGIPDGAQFAILPVVIAKAAQPQPAKEES